MYADRSGIAMGDTMGQRETFALPSGCKEGYVVANGIRFHYVEAGTGPLVILLHGFPEFWYSWRYQLGALGERFHVVAPDLRGYNLSDKPATGYDIVTLTSDVRGLIEAFGEQRADIVGHDWGGAIAWAFATRFPDFLRRLVILNAPHPATSLREMRHPRQLARSLYVGFFQLRNIPETAIRLNDYAFIRRIFRADDPDHRWMSDVDIERYIEALRRPDALTRALDYYRRLRPRYLGEISPGRMITRPTLVLWGESDPALGTELLEGLDRWLRPVLMLRYPAAGHWLNQQMPDAVNNALLAFLRDDSIER